MCISSPCLSLFTAGLLASLLTALVGCGDPCLDLAKKICACETSTIRRQQCEVRVKGEAEDSTPTAEEQERCSNKLDSCNCVELAKGNLEVCGLAPEDPSEMGIQP